MKVLGRRIGGWAGGGWAGRLGPIRVMLEGRSPRIHETVGIFTPAEWHPESYPEVSNPFERVPFSIKLVNMLLRSSAPPASLVFDVFFMRTNFQKTFENAI